MYKSGLPFFKEIFEQLWETAKEMHKEAISNGTERIVTNISIDHRTDKQIDMDHQKNKDQNSLE